MLVENRKKKRIQIGQSVIMSLWQVDWDLDLFSQSITRGSRGGGGGGGQGVQTGKIQNIGFLSNTSPDLLKLQSYQARFNVGPSSARQWNAIQMTHHRHASETPFKWRFAGGPMIARL